MEDNKRTSRKMQRRKEDKMVGRIVTIIVVALLVVGGVFAFSTYRFITSSLKPLDSSNSTKVVVNIPNGSSNKAIGNILEKDKIIKSGMVFNYYTKVNNLTGFQAGKYKFSPSMTLEQIGTSLKEGGLAEDQADATITIPEGYDLDQVADKIAAETPLKKSDFEKAMKNETLFNELLERYPKLLTSVSESKGIRNRLEGYLFPATYNYYEGMSVDTLIEEMVGVTNSVLSKYYDMIEETKMSVNEVMTLASLVEKEGKSEEDRKKIAQVFLNRLKIDMPLQSDISILYALGVHKELVLLEDLEIDSPYNLYKNTGFGPGPFDNPSEQAIAAVLKPTANEFLYFVADIKTQKVYYAKTLDEHNEFVEKYVNNQN